ncbi:MAG: DUF11 domain-containing protein [Bacteroidetes bacterium]|nr:DUF11 domain-containing protein [Bacteroidota bacterium]
MKKVLPVVFLSFLSTLIAPALIGQQLAPSIIWQKSFGGSKEDRALSVARCEGGGYLVAGSSKSNNGDVAGHHGSTDSTDAWLIKLAADGTIQWQKSIGGTGQDVLNHIVRTSDGGFIGIGTTTSIDGDLGSTPGIGWNDVWVVKLSRNGDIQWQKRYGGSQDDNGNTIHQTGDSGYIATALTWSKDGQVTGNSAALSAGWVIRIDPSGNLIWQHAFSTAFVYDIMALAGGGYLVGVGADGSGQGGFPAVGNNTPITYIGKLDNSGNLVAPSSVGGTGYIYGFQPISDTKFSMLAFRNYCAPTDYSAGFTVFPSIDTSTVKAGSSYIFGASGSICTSAYYSRGFQTNGPNSFVNLDNSGGVVVAAAAKNGLNGYHTGPLINSTYLPSDGYISSFDASGWNKCYGGAGDDGFNAVIADDSYTYVAAGFSTSTNGDATVNNGGYDFWIVKLGKTNHIKGTVYIDENSNGSHDPGETFVNSVLVQSTKGSVTASSSTFDGVFDNLADTGTTTTTIISPLPRYTVVPASKTTNFTSYNTTDSFSFALQPIPNLRDYRVMLFNTGRSRPGFGVTYKIICTNPGTDVLTNRMVQLVVEHRLSYQSATPTPVSVTGDTMRWILPTLTPRDTAIFTVQMVLAAGQYSNLEILTSTATIDSTGDIEPKNNVSVINDVVTGSFDPNGKEEVNGGTIDTAALNNGRYLHYTIRFQNTGNDTAFSVVLRDTLISKLDPATLEMVDASHPYRLTIANGNQLTWTFPNILLPYSSENEPASHGYVSYRVKPKSNVALGDSIRNEAGIYFDFNPVVQTNTALTVVNKPATQLPPPPPPVNPPPTDPPVTTPPTDPPTTPPVTTLPQPPGPQVSGILDSYCANQSAQKVQITNVPPAADSVTIAATMDGSAMAIAGDGSLTVNPSSLTSGTHMLMISFTNTAGMGTMYKSFQVFAVVTPRVSIRSSLTTISDADLTGTIQVKASNLAGGGLLPTFTFAKDPAFVSILKSESADSTLQLSPASLVIGSNPVYVRMRTSAPCNTAQSVMDSVVISRHAGEGLSDPDNPDQKIGTAPNPFIDQINITGLQRTKSYLFQLEDVLGQQKSSMRVSGQASALFRAPGLPRGMYLLRVIDATGQKLIGTVKLNRL